jgi:hypothetical protein
MPSRQVHGPRLRTLCFLAAVAAPGIAQAALPHQQDPSSEWAQVTYLYEGKLPEGERALAEALRADPSNRQLRYGLGVTQFLGAVEGLAQRLNRFGATQNAAVISAIPFARLPVPNNEGPEPVRAADLRATLVEFVAGLARVEQTLKPLDDAEVKLAIDLGRVHLDLDADGAAQPHEGLWTLYQAIARGVREDPDAEPAEPESRIVVFDRGDVAWIRGYAHLLSALAEAILAHDMHTLFEHAAHLVFPRAVVAHDFLRPPSEEISQDLIIDGIAAIHLMRFPLKEPERMRSALEHLEACVALSRESWRFYSAETDDDHEWIPNPNQTLFGGQQQPVTREMVTGWAEFLDEFESILKGKTLVPFWRDAGGKGINVRRVFTEPREFDLVLWVQGTAAAPYLERGPVSQPEVWARLQRVFRGEFFGFAAWFN